MTNSVEGRRSLILFLMKLPLFSLNIHREDGAGHNGMNGARIQPNIDQQNEASGCREHGDGKSAAA